MGFFDTGSRAATSAGRFDEAAIEELMRTFTGSESDLEPFVKAGQFALPDVLQGSTVGGLDTRLSEILGSGAFESLVGERTRAVEGQLAAGGLTRSGTAIEEAAAIPTDLAFLIENLLSGRSTGIAGSGQNAALGLGTLGAAKAADIATLRRGQGQDVASGILTDRQSKVSAITTAANIASKIFFG